MLLWLEAELWHAIFFWLQTIVGLLILAILFVLIVAGSLFAVTYIGLWLLIQISGDPRWR